MRIYVLGTGPSLSKYEPDGNISIGVNDIARYNVHPDYLLLVDPNSNFANSDKIEFIKKTKCKKTLAFLYDWYFMPGFEKLNFADILCTGPGRCNMSHLDDQRFYPYSTSSTWIAVVIAYRLGAKEIIMYGVDFINYDFCGHPELLPITLDHFKILYAELKKRNVNLFLGSSESLLASVIPSYHF